MYVILLFYVLNFILSEVLFICICHLTFVFSGNISLRICIVCMIVVTGTGSLTHIPNLTYDALIAMARVCIRKGALNALEP